MTASTGSFYKNIPDVRLKKVPVVLAVKLTSLNVDVVPTPILAETDFSMYDVVMLVFINDGAFNYTVTLTTGEVTGAVDSIVSPSILVPAKSGAAPGQTTYTIGPDSLRKLWRATGTASGGLTAARFEAKALQR